MGFRLIPYQNVCVHHIPQIMLEKVLHIQSRTSLCCLDSCWDQSFSCWERWQSELLLNYLYKLIHFVHVCVAFWPLIVVIILLCHYLVLIYVHFHISHVISWSSHGDGHCRLLAGVTFLNQEFFRIHFTRPRNIAKSLKYCCPICLMSSGGTLELYFSTSLTLVCWWTGGNLRGHWVPPFLVGMGPPLPKCPASQ